MTETTGADGDLENAAVLGDKGCGLKKKAKNCEEIISSR
jgi:hypothetical protein